VWSTLPSTKHDQKGEEGSNKVAKSLLPEVKKAQQDLGAKPIPDDGAPTVSRRSSPETPHRRALDVNPSPAA
jgi:hypothetical protein